jgi:glycosyltransferase involved in cell wall biosynthesis
MSKLKDFNLIVMASTYPRWPGDSMRAFVQDYVRHMSAHFKNIRVIVPHYKGAQHSERPAPNIRVSRFFYAFPARFENIAYGEFQKTKGYLIKSALYNASELWSTLLAGLRWRPLILNPHWLIPQGFVAVLLKPVLRARVVVSVHGADVYTLNGKFMKKVKRFVLKHADAVVTNSSASKAACEELWPRDYHVIPMGVDTAVFTPGDFQPAGEVFELLFVGRLAEEKGVRYLCQAVKLLQEKDVRVQTTIVGDGAQRSSLEAYIRQHNLGQDITLAGSVPHDELPAYYAKADAFVGPSIESSTGWQEALGLVFAEASAMGLPVIATATGGIKDVVRDGVNGLLVPQKDAAAIAAAIIKLQQDPALCRKLASAGPRFIQENFSWPVVTRKYLDVFRSLV